jgi:hypothetical protein
MSNLKYYHDEWPGKSPHNRVGRIHVEAYTDRSSGICYLEVLLILGANSAEFILDTDSHFATVLDLIAD